MGTRSSVLDKLTSVIANFLQSLIIHPLLIMDYKLMMLAAVAVALIALTTATATPKTVGKCITCTGDAKSDCATKGEADEKACTKDTDDKFCAKVVTYEKNDWKTVKSVARSCAATCTDKEENKDAKTKTFCCNDKDNCNGVSSVSAGVTTVVLAVAAVFLKNLY